MPISPIRPAPRTDVRRAVAPSADVRSDRAAPAAGAHAFVVGEDEGGQRLDRFLARAAEQRGLVLSRTRFKALIEAGQATVDGAAAREPAARVADGAAIALVVPAAEEAAIVGEDLALDIVFEDEHLLSSTSRQASSSTPRPATPPARWSTR